MFSFVPPVVTLNTDMISGNMITVNKIHHSTVNNSSYRSLGERRKKEMHCIFHYTVKGSGEVLYKGKAYRTKPGEGFFNIINEDQSGYGFYDDAEEPWEFIVICFDGGNTRQIVKELLEKKVIYAINKNDEEKFRVLCKRLLEESGTNLKLTFFPMLLSMIYDTDVSNSRLSLRFKEIVEEEFMKNLNVSTIAYKMGISREHLHREFFKENGITPLKYLNNKRFEKLCLLLTTSNTEKQIADMMGFPSLSDMIIFFKKFAGITPSQYRKKGYISL